MTEHKLAVKCEIAINGIAAHTWDAQHWGRDVKVGGVSRMQEGLRYNICTHNNSIAIIVLVGGSCNKL